MPKVITFSRTFPSYHPKKGQPTWFVEKFWKSIYDTPYFNYLSDIEANFTNVFGMPDSHLHNIHNHKPKRHTIREGHRFEVGEMFSPRVWGNDVNPKNGRSGPYQSKQITIGPDIEIVKIFDFKLTPTLYYVDGRSYDLNNNFDLEIIDKIATNDGLEYDDLMYWFKWPKPFDGQIICWNEEVAYGQ